MVYIVKLYQSSDPSWDTFGISISSGIEIAVAIIAASIPATNPIMNKLFPRLFPSSSGGSQSASRRGYHPGSRIESTSRRYQSNSIPLSRFTRRQGSDTDDESTKAIVHANWPWYEKPWRQLGERIRLYCIYRQDSLGKKQEEGKRKDDELNNDIEKEYVHIRGSSNYPDPGYLASPINLT